MLPQAEISTYLSQIFWLIISFGLLYFVIAQFLAPKIENILIARQKIIDNDLNDANSLTEKIAKLKADYESAIISIYDQAQNYKRSNLNNFNELCNNKKLELQRELNELKSISLEEIYEVKKRFFFSLESSAIDVASLIIEKIINQKPKINILQTCYAKIVDK